MVTAVYVRLVRVLEECSPEVDDCSPTIFFPPSNPPSLADTGLSGAQVIAWLAAMLILTGLFLVLWMRVANRTPRYHYHYPPSGTPETITGETDQ